MQAVTFNEFGGPEVLTITDMPTPVAGPDEVLVKVTASTVNPTDVMMRNGTQAPLMTDLTPPYIAGMEFSGTILDPGTSSLQIGQPVIGVINPRTPSGGSYAQIIKVPAASVATVSTDTDLAGAATVPMNALTAALSLDFLALQPGQTLMVTGGAGMLGGSAIQLAKAAGLTVLANVADKDRTLVEGLGADVILPRDAGLEEALRNAYPEGVDGVIDGALIGQQISHLVKDGGGIVSLRGNYKIEDERLRVLNVSVMKGMLDTATMQRIADLISSGGLVPRVAQSLNFRDAEEGHRLTELGGMRGRIVLTFTD